MLSAANRHRARRRPRFSNQGALHGRGRRDTGGGAGEDAEARVALAARFHHVAVVLFGDELDDRIVGDQCSRVASGCSSQLA
ncbi:MAG: hypothetical protein FJ033_07515 [Chloroflexi bacterium]|nr:hypothetical protein [Chloroflexota bacterium]